MQYYIDCHFNKSCDFRPVSQTVPPANRVAVVLPKKCSCIPNTPEKPTSNNEQDSCTSRTTVSGVSNLH